MSKTALHLFHAGPSSVNTVTSLTAHILHPSDGGALGGVTVISF